jgi:hypothetical protein
VETVVLAVPAEYSAEWVAWVAPDEVLDSTAMVAMAASAAASVAPEAYQGGSPVMAVMAASAAWSVVRPCAAARAVRAA